MTRFDRLLSRRTLQVLTILAVGITVVVATVSMATGHWLAVLLAGVIGGGLTAALVGIQYIRSRLGALTARVRAIEVQLRTLERDAVRLSTQRPFNDAIVERVRSVESSATRQGSFNDAIVQRVRSVEASSGQARSGLERVGKELQDTRELLKAAVVSLRSELESVNRSLVGLPDADQLSVAAQSGVPDPVLSIAIPSFNRPELLQRCIDSVVAEVEAVADGSVELVITDDCSTDPRAIDIALTVAREKPFVSLHLNPENLGLERNLIQACRPCRGEFVLILGNDDALVPGSLSAVVRDLADGTADIYLYDKTRVAGDGRTPKAAVPGSSPADLGEGESCRFTSPIAAAGQSGLLSTFGFISQVVFRRNPFLDIDPTPYFGLTMYAQVAVMLEAFRDSEVHYRNLAIVYHRTPDPADKAIEAFGRPEEQFMGGRAPKLARYFGNAYAAMLQRLIDRGALDAGDLVDLPERLFASMPLVAWIEHNIGLAESLGTALDDDVIVDGRRLVESLGTAARQT